MKPTHLKSLIRLEEGTLEEKTLVWMELLLFGRDFVIFIGGGEAHLGSMIVSDGGKKEQFTLLGHREDELVRMVMEQISPVTDRELLVLGGIHYPQISKEQIEAIMGAVMRLCGQLKAEIAALRLDFSQG